MDNRKDQYAKAVCFFLAEQLRCHKISLARSAEIAQKVVDNINLIDTEEDFLRLVKSLSADFQELFGLQERVSMNIHINERQQMEAHVREFAANILVQDMPQAARILEAAIHENVKSTDLCGQFPKFQEFLTQHSHAHGRTS